MLRENVLLSFYWIECVMRKYWCTLSTLLWYFLLKCQLYHSKILNCFKIDNLKWITIGQAIYNLIIWVIRGGKGNTVGENLIDFFQTFSKSVLKKKKFFKKYKYRVSLLTFYLCSIHNKKEPRRPTSAHGCDCPKTFLAKKKFYG